jgi:Tfp pilus assembly protein PilW
MLEMMVSIFILLVVSAIAFSFLIQYQNAYQSTALKADMHSGLRAATTLLEQEIGEAGLVSLSAYCSAGIPATSTSGCPTLTAAVSAGATSATLSTTAGMFVGESLLVDVGSAQEVVTVNTVASATSITLSTGFISAHASGTIVSATGMFPQGILSPGQTGGSSFTQLNMIGDLIGDGNLYYVQYTCNTPAWSQVTYSSAYAAWSSTTTYSQGQNVNYNGLSYVSNTSSNLGNSPTTPGTLTRSVTQLAGPSPVTAQGSAVPLLDDLAANPNGAPCFQYSTASVTIGSSTYTFTTTVSLTLTVQTSEIDPVTGTLTQETKSFLNLEPRNVLAGYNLAQYVGTANLFQANPSGACSGVTWSTGTPSPAC